MILPTPISVDNTIQYNIHEYQGQYNTSVNVKNHSDISDRTDDQSAAK